jgi:hypothetical protein
LVIRHIGRLIAGAGRLVGLTYRERRPIVQEKRVKMVVLDHNDHVHVGSFEMGPYAFKVLNGIEAWSKPCGIGDETRRMGNGVGRYELRHRAISDLISSRDTAAIRREGLGGGFQTSEIDPMEQI